VFRAVQVQRLLVALAWLGVKHSQLMRALLGAVRLHLLTFQFPALADIYTAIERLDVNDSGLAGLLEDAMAVQGAESQRWDPVLARQLLECFARVRHFPLFLLLDSDQPSSRYTLVASAVHGDLLRCERASKWQAGLI
jgi:hypothetical protein